MGTILYLSDIPIEAFRFSIYREYLNSIDTHDLETFAAVTVSKLLKQTQYFSIIYYLYLCTYHQMILIGECLFE